MAETQEYVCVCVCVCVHTPDTQQYVTIHIRHMIDIRQVIDKGWLQLTGSLK